MLESELQRAVGERELAYAGREGQAQELRDLRRYLPRVGIDRVASEQDQVEPAEHLDGSGERLGGGPRVAARERRVGDVYPVIGAERDGFAEHVLCARWAQCDDGERAAAGARQLGPLGHRAAAVVVHVQLEPVALQATIGAEGERFDLRDLFDERSDPQRRGHGGLRG